MNNHLPEDTALQDLAGELAELETQLRLLLANPVAEDGGWPVLASLAVRNDLLAGLATEGGHAAMAALTTALSALLETGLNRPGVLPAELEALLLELDSTFAAILLALDGGRGLEAALARPDWQWLRLRLRFLDTPLEVFADLHAALGQWQERWCDAELNPETEAEMARRWALLRDLGDALFESEASSGENLSLLRWQGFDGED